MEGTDEGFIGRQGTGRAVVRGKWKGWKRGRSRREGEVEENKEKKKRRRISRREELKGKKEKK